MYAFLFSSSSAVSLTLLRSHLVLNQVCAFQTVHQYLGKGKTASRHPLTAENYLLHTFRRCNVGIFPVLCSSCSPVLLQKVVLWGGVILALLRCAFKKNCIPVLLLYSKARGYILVLRLWDLRCKVFILLSVEKNLIFLWWFVSSSG